MKNNKHNIMITAFYNEDFGTIRTTTGKDGEPWFVGKDVSKALGYANHRSSIRNHVDKEDKHVVQLVDTQEGAVTAPSHERGSKILIINESGLYSLILSSSIPSAQKFKHWVTSEVLPQIRRTGGYIPTRDLSTGEQLTDTQIMRLSENIMLNTISSVNKIADGCVTTKAIAESLGTTVKDVNRQLVKYGILFWNGSRYKLDTDLAGAGLTQDRSFHYFALDGTKKERTYLVWTKTGVEFVRNVMLNA